MNIHNAVGYLTCLAPRPRIPTRGVSVRVVKRVEQRERHQSMGRFDFENLTEAEAGNGMAGAHRETVETVVLAPGDKSGNARNRQ